MNKTSFFTKRHLVLPLFLLFSFYVDAQTDKVVIGNIDSLESKILNEQRKIWVYVPDGGRINDGASTQKYPVVYLLDGDAHFYSVVGMIQQLSQVNGNTVCPEMIVVGILNTDRTRDLTPTHILADPPFMDSIFSRTSGGGEKFMSFIEKELMPHIDSIYPTQPYKMLIGHSFGGLTVMNTVINHTKLFNAYICIDPSMWWDNMNYLKATKKALSEKNFTGTTLYLGIANTMEEGMDVNDVPNDTSVGSRHIRSILEMDKFIQDNNPKGLKYDSKYYNHDDHGSVPLIAAYDALRFVFENYQFKFSFKDFMDSTSALAPKLEKHYAEVSNMMSYIVYPPEKMINGLGYEVLSLKQFAKAAALFKMNVANYPQSQNVYDSYGDYFVAIGDKENAIVQFKKALSIKEFEATRKKLDELEAKAADKK